MPLIEKAKPTSIKPAPEVLEKIRKIAKANGLSIHSVMNLCMASGLNIVEAKMNEMRGH